MDPTVEMPQMAEYGVEAGSWTGLPWWWAEERLLANRNYWVSTVSPQGFPHSLPVWGVWCPDLQRFGFSCALTSTKLRNIRSNPHVVVTNSDTVEVVSVQGTAEVLDADDPARETIISTYVAKYGSEAPGDLAAFLRSNAVVVVVPQRAFGVIEREAEFASRATRWQFVRPTDQLAGG